jgi:hypothetical protein
LRQVLGGIAKAFGLDDGLTHAKAAIAKGCALDAATHFIILSVAKDLAIEGEGSFASIHGLSFRGEALHFVQHDKRGIWYNGVQEGS